MREVVLDASVVLKWFDPASRPRSAEARALLEDYRAGRLTILVPSVLFLEAINVAGRQWRVPADGLVELARRLQELAFEVADPPLAAVVSWVSRGLTAYDASYVALAESRGVPLVTDDQQILRSAQDVATPLGSA